MGKKQDESLKYMEGNYSNIWRLPGEFWEDVQQASEMMDAEEYWKDYMDNEKAAREEHHYLVEGAVLTCTACTMKPVRPFKEEFTAPEGSNERQLKITEERKLLNGAGQRFATVKDRVKWENIEPFGNCKNPPNREKEIKDVQMAETSEELRKSGTCVHLMDIRDDWENLLGEGGYDSCPFFFFFEEGITMEAILFCSHGGFIYPKSSGYIPTEDEVEEIEDPDILLPLDPTNPQEVKEYMWEYFLQQGFSEVAVAGILGNVQQESSFSPEVISPNDYYGLFQWGGERKNELVEAGKKWARERGLPEEDGWTHVEFQCEYAVQDYESGINGWGSNYVFRGDGSILHAKKNGFRNYLRCSRGSHGLGSRI